MQVRVSGKQIDIGEALPVEVRNRLQSAVEKHFSNGADGSVVFSREGIGLRADCTVHLNSGITLQAHGVGDDAYRAFDMAVERLEKRVRRYTRRLKDHHERASAPPPGLATEHVIAPSGDEADEPVSLQPVIVAETQTQLRNWSVGEAVMQLELQESPVLIFRNAANGRLNAVYRRADGNIGWIDPSA